jgi:hypothetical protein
MTHYDNAQDLRDIAKKVPKPQKARLLDIADDIAALEHELKGWHKIVDFLKSKKRWLEPKDRHPAIPTTDSEHVIAQISGMIVFEINRDDYIISLKNGDEE